MDAALTICLMLLKSAHHRRTAVDVAPSLEVRDWDMSLVTLWIEQVTQIELLDCDLNVDVEAVPE